MRGSIVAYLKFRIFFLYLFTIASPVKFVFYTILILRNVNTCLYKFSKWIDSITLINKTTIDNK